MLEGENGDRRIGAAGSPRASSVPVLTPFNDAISTALSVICAALLALIIATVIVQVAGRYIFLTATPWAEEVAVYCLVWTVFLGMSLGIRDRSHLVADFLPRDLSPMWDRAVTLFADVMVTTLIAAFIWYGTEYALVGRTRYSESMGFSMVYIYAALPIASVFAALFLIEQYLETWRNWRPA